MPKIKFTSDGIGKLKYADKGQIVYWDTNTPGLGLVVGLKTKTFRLQLDVKDTSKSKGYRTVKKTLGRYGTEMTLEQAKEMIRGHVDSETGQAVIGERLKLKMDTPEYVDAPGSNKTLKELLDEYYRLTKRRDGKERRALTAIRYTTLVCRHFEGWMDMFLPEIVAITPDVILEKYRLNESEFGGASARNSSAVLIAVLNYGKAAYPGAVLLNPLAVLSNPHLCIRKAKGVRHDCLTHDPAKNRHDFLTFYEGIQHCIATLRDGFLFTLYTGMRRAEVEGLGWNNVDMEHAELFLTDTKNRRDLHIPINKQAMQILERRKELTTGTKIFPQARTGGKNSTGCIQLNATKLKNHTGLDITVHGLRRTFITVGRQLKRYEDTDRLTNHVDGSMAGKHYDETSVEDLRETAQMIGNEIERRMLAEKAKVIDITTGRQAA